MHNMFNISKNLFDKKKIKNVIFWGAGPNVKEFADKYCKKGKILPKPIGILETTRKVKLKSDFLKGIPFISLNDLKKFGPDNTLIIITAGILELYAQVIKNELYYFKITHKKSVEFYSSILKNQKKYFKAFNLLKEKKSKDIFKKKINNIINSVFIDNALQTSTNPYIPNEFFNYRTKKNIIYAGAFNGNIIDQILKVKDFNILAFEPSKIQYQNLIKKYKNNKNVTIQNKLLHENNKFFNFNDDMLNNGLSASVNRKDVFGNSYKVQGYMLDQSINKFHADIIALDIEGSELNALKGSKNYINKLKPILCICIYHSPEDHFRIINYINEKHKNIYNFFVRHHSNNCYIETVLYCTPK